MRPVNLIMVLLIMPPLLLLSSPSLASTFGQKLCKKEGYHCVRVKRKHSWRVLFPDEHDRSIAMRVNRMNTEIYAGMVIAVPHNIAEADIMDFSPFPRQIEPTGEKMIIIDPANIAWGAFDTDGTQVRWGPASSGSDWCPDINEACHTHEGNFRIFSRGSSDCISHKFPLPDGGAPMPYCMFFNNGQALHGEPNGLPGYNASHGCVRLYVNDAEWLRYSFVEGASEANNYRGTRVIVWPYYSSGYSGFQDGS